MSRKPLVSRRLRIVSLAAGFLFWSGEAAMAAPVVTDAQTTDFYTTNEVMNARGAGGLPTRIFGGPSSKSTAASATAGLSLPATVGGGRIKPVGSGAAPAGSYMVLLFNASSMDGETACRTPAEGGAKKLDGPLNVFAALCRGNRYFSQAHLRDESVSGESDPHYARAMEQLFLSLMPPDSLSGEQND